MTTEHKSTASRACSYPKKQIPTETSMSNHICAKRNPPRGAKTKTHPRSLRRLSKSSPSLSTNSLSLVPFSASTMVGSGSSRAASDTGAEVEVGSDNSVEGDGDGAAEEGYDWLWSGGASPLVGREDVDAELRGVGGRPTSDTS